MLLTISVGEEIIGTFYEKEPQKTNQQEFSIEKVIKKKGDKLFVKNDVKKTAYNKLVAKVNSVDTSAFVLETKYDTDNQN